MLPKWQENLKATSKKLHDVLLQSDSVRKPKKKYKTGNEGSWKKAIDASNTITVTDWWIEAPGEASVSLRRTRKSFVGSAAPYPQLTKGQRDVPRQPPPPLPPGYLAPPPPSVAEEPVRSLAGKKRRFDEVEHSASAVHGNSRKKHYVWIRRSFFLIFFVKKVVRLLVVK